MTISSRTPEGTPHRCPVCGHGLRVEASLFFGDAPCPRCGTLLWFIQLGDDPRFFDWAETVELRERLIEAVAAYLGMKPEKLHAEPELLEKMELDSVDLMEIGLEVEELAGDGPYGGLHA